MSFEQRKAQLEALLRAGDMDRIWDIYRGGPMWDGRMPPVGMLASEMIEKILEREFHEEYARSKI
jgi:hypothetical protein